MATKDCSTCRWGPECKLSDYVKKWCKEEDFFRWEPKIGDKWIYTDGACICPVCKKEYRKHPIADKDQSLNVICTGLLVKL